ncbi:MFS transporter [Pseudalkalibacillus salsuginis]|uniref:MFS transporter n=1 Tax=Pseudalkalibacillus salsuginis TaxID=2910972 RepID=UPI001F325A0F|nr:MFS transporter [Pseudalkalibacillus salsuginis]MCF6409553.1 MFS transporter [Pseudalkalibacillus salsuginis]
MRNLLWIGSLSYLLIGLAHVVMGAVLEELLQYFQRDYSDGGLLIFAQFSGFLIGVLTTPWWSKQLGRRGMILLAFGALTLGQSVYSFLPSWEWMIVTAPLAGFGFGMVEAAIGALVIGFVHKNKAVAMSRLEVFFGIGACVMPVLGSVLIMMGLWKISFPILAAMSLGMLILWSFISFGSMDAVLTKQDSSEEKGAASGTDIQGEEAPSLNGRRGLPLLFIMVVFFFLYVGIEMSLVHFLPSILIEHSGTSSALGTLGVSFFWIAMVIGRLFAGHLSEKWGYGRYLLMNGFGSLLVMAIIPLITGLAASYSLILLLGLLMAGLFAIGLIFTNQILPGTAERTTSLLIAAGGLGGALLPLLTGKVMDQYKSVISMWTLIGLMALMMAMLVIVIRLSDSVLVVDRKVNVEK